MKNYTEYFVSVEFFVEDNFHDVTLDFLENHELYLSVDFKKDLNRVNFWKFKVLLFKGVNKIKFLNDMNFLRKKLNLPPLNMKKKSKKLDLITIKFTRIKDQNWLEKIKDNFKPIIIDDLYIFDDDYHRFNQHPKISIKIKASLAFGSGYHETTKHCLRAIKHISKRRRVKSLIDYGTGTGILGISFKKRIPSANSIYIDNDRNSIKIAKQNIQKNNLPFISDIFLNPRDKKKYLKKNHYDIVVANILLQPLKILIKEFDYIIKKKSFLIVSGILAKQMRCLINKYRKFNFIIYKLYMENNWVTIIFKRL